MCRSVHSRMTFTLAQLSYLPRLTSTQICHGSKLALTSAFYGFYNKSHTLGAGLSNRGLHLFMNHRVRNISKVEKYLPSWKLTNQLHPAVRGMKTRIASETKTKRTAVIYVTAVGVFMVGMTYAGVPLYRMFCQATGLGGQATVGHDTGKVETMKAVKDRSIRIRFNADTHSSMQWNFRPQQAEVKVLPGETALAFYTAMNPTDKPIIGISTYNVLPFEAGQYFNKIQCFCFEEQRLNPHEKVDMPVFFYIDPEFAEDPKLETVDLITLSYTFFEAKEGMELPLPGFMQNYPPHSTQPQ